MGASSYLDPGQRLLPPDTPPDLVSPGISNYSSRSSPATEAAWTTRPLASPPMSDYEKGFKPAIPGEKGGEGPAGQAAVHGQMTSRQQLPSLSSLFGPPSSRAANSPMSDRNAAFPAASPMERPRVSSHGSRGHGDSYFPPTLSPPVSQPRTSYDVKYDTERSNLQTLRHSVSQPASPGFRAFNHARSDSRPDADGPHRWAPHTESAKAEYTLGSRESLFHGSRGDHFRLQFPGQKDASPNQTEHRPSNGLNPPPTPTSTSTSEGLPSKDGLGPKIWTGTHFLPRFVRAAEVPGEGLCYFYDDGSHCKTVIDGEAVNAHWGVTKAGKPRKRLAIACVTCREKKIKCDPDYPRCVQCEKFGRICKFKNAPRGGHNGSPSTPPAEFEEPRKLGGPSRPDDYRDSESNASSPRSPRPMAHHVPSPEGGSHKRIKVDHGAYTPNGEASPALARPLDHTKSQRSTPLVPQEMPQIPESVLNRAWQTDPYVTDPQSINAVIGQFFANIDSTMILSFLPEHSTKSWVANSAHRKSPEDLMLLYSILAVGVALSGGHKNIAFEYAQVANYAQQRVTTNCLQVAQSRILLAVYFYSVSRRREATEVMAAATTTVAALQLNIELENTREASLPTFPLGLTGAGYSESRRRTLWALFMLERLNGLYPDRLSMISAEDIYIRVPADQRSFEEQTESRSPLFSPFELNFGRTMDQPQEVAAYLVEIVHLWAESQSSVYKLIHRPASAEAEAARTRSLIGAVEHWRSILPSRLIATRSNLETAALSGQVGSFLTMHLLYSHAMLRLNRYSRVPHRPGNDTRWNHIHKCQNHALEVVEMIDNLDRVLRARPVTLSVPPPMVAVVVAEAVDILSASRPLTALNKVVDDIRVMKPLVDAMSNVWEDSRDLRYAIDQRLHLLSRVRERASHSPSTVEGFRIISKPLEQKHETNYHWEIFEPLERSYGRSMDMIYPGFD